MATATVPAYAASPAQQCNLVVAEYDNIHTEYGDYTQQSTNQILAANELDAAIQGLPQGEKIVSAKVTVFIERTAQLDLPPDGNQGFYLPADVETNFGSNAISTSGSLNPGWVFGGWSDNSAEKTYVTSQGTVTRDMWTLTFTNNNLNTLGVYTPLDDGCVFFELNQVSPNNSPWTLNYTGVPPQVNSDASGTAPNLSYEYVFVSSAGRTFTLWSVDMNVNNQRVVEFHDSVAP